MYIFIHIDIYMYPKRERTGSRAQMESSSSTPLLSSLELSDTQVLLS